MTKSEQKALRNIDDFQEVELIEFIRVNKKSEKIKVKCLSCGTIFERWIHHFNNNPHNCPSCRPRKIANKLSLVQAQERTDAIFNGELELLEYKGNNTLINVKCKKCGEIFSSVPTCLWRSRTKGCPQCSKTISLGEKKIKEFLEKKQIQYIREYRFPGCKDVMTLPFDFYLPALNIAIEYQGEQHYKKESFYYSDKIQKHNDIKKQYCEEEGIKLICIPYTEDVSSYLEPRVK